MVTSPSGSQPVHRFNWRAVLVGLLATVGMASLVGYTMVHWVERQVLTTDNWVQVVGPIPKDDTVATALSTYAVDQLFTATDLENKIAEALPDRAAFLAPALTDQLDTRLTKRTKQAIQSDKFQSIWEAANREASERLLTKARDPQAEEQKAMAKFSLDLPALKDTVTSILNKRTGQTAVAIEPSDNAKKNVGLVVNLKASIEKVHSYIRLADFLNATLWLFGLVCVVGAIALSRTRRRLLLILSASAVVLSLLQIIGVKAFRPYILDQIQQSSFRPAIGVVYDNLLATFRTQSVTIFFWSLVLFVVVLVLHKPFLTRSKAIAGWMKEVGRTEFWKYGVMVRTKIGDYRYYLMAAVTVIGLAIVAFAVDLDWATGVQSVLFTILVIEFIALAGIRTRPRRPPMKQ